MKPEYLKWLIKEKDVIFDNGKSLFCYEIDYDDEESILDDWALHLRRHYISDEELEEDCEELDLPVGDYLKKILFHKKRIQWVEQQDRILLVRYYFLICWSLYTIMKFQDVDSIICQEKPCQSMGRTL